MIITQFMYQYLLLFLPFKDNDDFKHFLRPLETHIFPDFDLSSFSSEVR